jgi:cardiolipin synthase
MIISDDQIVTIGSANLDIRSFEQNYEVNVLAYDVKLSHALKMDFLKDCTKSDRIDYQEFLGRPRMDRLKEGFAKIFSPIL